MNRSLARSFMLLVLALLAAPRIAHAAQSYDNCAGFITSLPTVINTQGTWCFNHDLNTALTSGNAITINTNNVTIDCNDFKLGGLAAGLATQTTGIYATARLNATVRHCNIRGFYVGLDLDGGGHLVEDNRFDGNTFSGLRVGGDGSLVQRNRVSDTGGSTVAADVYGLSTADSVDTLNNTVSGVMATSGSNGTAYGIHTYGNLYGSVNGNRVRAVVKDGTGLAYGIYNVAGSRVTLTGNNVVGDGSGGFMGISCESGIESVTDNIISGYASGMNCVNDGGNVIKP